MEQKLKELYEKTCDPTYNEILPLFGTILIQVDENSYQGDSWVLYKWGYLQFGWGSCSGCDELYACRNLQEIIEFTKELQSKIIWFGSKEDCKRFFETHDFQGDYCYSNSDFQNFLAKVRTYLNEPTSSD